MDDAVWVLPSSSYVDPGPPLETSLFDDPQRLNRAWSLTMSTLRAEAQESPQQRRQVEDRARALIDEANLSVTPSGDRDAGGSVEAPVPIAEPKDRRRAGFVDRADRLAQATLRVARLRHS
ncbi:hypothetical protein [Micromonospora sp. U21]|uniref:hypothetical protein n=1 Tax=Micromonospora sp. U21 TaxID=2824899 RepID=UPI001B375846|nr:hypothetical protein [Micromonospora sp. U21]MBQ0900432.1 hypothetical protein [Micromonospora sp. U21]